MDVYHTSQAIEFVWDSEKAASNLKKHRVSFEMAVLIFHNSLTAFYDASVPEEQRSAAIGKSLDHQLLYVVHIEYENGRIRIIMAREAEPKERKRYEKPERET